MCVNVIVRNIVPIAVHDSGDKVPIFRYSLYSHLTTPLPGGLPRCQLLKQRFLAVRGPNTLTSPSRVMVRLRQSFSASLRWGDSSFISVSPHWDPLSSCF